MARFDVTKIQVNLAGLQPAVIDAHVTTRTGHRAEMITVGLGNLLVQCYDLAAVRAFAAACRSAAGFAPAGFPDVFAGTDAVAVDRNGAGIVLRVAGKPTNVRTNGIGFTGRPHVRLEIGRLVAHVYDRAALTSWTAAWEDAERLALRIWPERDAFDEVEQGERDRIARTGTPRKARR